MKQSPKEIRAQELMQPGVITQQGMLGEDNRPLNDILVDDNAEVQRLGVTHKSIAFRMRALRKMGRAGLGTPVDVENHFEVTVDGFRGRIACPFEDGTASKVNTKVVNKRIGKEVIFTDLHIHMIFSHGFYMGRGSTYRLDPTKLVEVLEVAPEPPPSPL